MTMATVLGLLCGTIARVWQGAPDGVAKLGAAVGVALAFSVTFASFLGFVLLWVLVKHGADHAPGADPFLTIIKDFTGLGVYFVLVSLLMGTWRAARAIPRHISAHLVPRPRDPGQLSGCGSDDARTVTSRRRGTPSSPPAAGPLLHSAAG
jgi:hypothetical protein